MRGLNFNDKRAGKLARLEARMGCGQIGQSLVLTDSMDDAALLAKCGRGCLTRWPLATYRAAFGGVYLPFEYLSRVKRPNSRYIWHSIIQEDFAFWILASIAVSPAPVFHVAGLLLLLVSFWSVYETGYVDNDDMAAKYEADPKLSDTYASRPVATPRWTPWLWAATFGFAGTCVLAWPQPPHAAAIVSWMACLAATKACFLLFNRLDKKSRVWLFAPLQGARAAAIVVVVGIVPVGAAGLAAHAVSLWIPYLLYRHLTGSAWPKLPVFALRLMIFLIFAGLILASEGPGRFDWGVAAAFAGWNLFRARREVAAIVGGAKRIDRDRASEDRSVPAQGGDIAQAAEGVC